MSDGPIVKRDPTGRFVAGVSGNPSGQSKEIRELMRLARTEVAESFAFAARLRDCASANWRDRLEAARFLVAYGVGAPPKTLSEDESEHREMLASLSDADLREMVRALDRGEVIDGELIRVTPAAAPSRPPPTGPAAPVRKPIDSTPGGGSAFASASIVSQTDPKKL